MTNNSSRQVEWAIFLSKLLAVSLIVWGFSYWRSLKVPMNISGIENMQKEPQQTTTSLPAFDKQTNGHSYKIEPLFDYEIWGLVVSGHNSDSWLDSDHESWNDYINTKDLCIIWGGNVINPHLQKLNFRNGNWTCYVSTKSSEAWQNFKMDQLSNNHIIPATSEIEKLVAEASVGDEVHIKGHLVNYSVNQGPARKSSTVRTDRENGACEIIYVKEFTTFVKHNKFWVMTARLSKILSGLLILAIVFVMFVFPLMGRDSFQD